MLKIGEGESQEQQYRQQQQQTSLREADKDLALLLLKASSGRSYEGLQLAGIREQGLEFKTQSAAHRLHLSGSTLDCAGRHVTSPPWHSCGGRHE